MVVCFSSVQARKGIVWQCLYWARKFQGTVWKRSNEIEYVTCVKKYLWYIRRFIKIVLPLQKPILATVSLFLAVGHWNDFFTTKLYITNTKLYTLQFLLYELLTQVQSAAQQIEYETTNQDVASAITTTGIRMTLTAIVMIPIILVYPFIQRYYVKGIMIGAVKG